MTDPSALAATGLLAVMVVVAIAALLVRDVLAATALFGIFSFAAATLFAMLGAVDVAFTEASVGGALSAILFVSVAFRTSRWFD